MSLTLSITDKWKQYAATGAKKFLADFNLQPKYALILKNVF